MKQLMKRDLFAAAGCGDIETLERYFAQPDARAAARAAERRISFKFQPVLDSRDLRHETIQGDAWMYEYVGGRLPNIFIKVVYQRQHEVMKWLFTSHFVALVPKTLQFFLVDAAMYAIDSSDLEMLEIVLTSPVFADSSVFSDSPEKNIFPHLLRKAIERECVSTLAVLTAHGADLHALVPPSAPPIRDTAIYDRTGDVIRSMIDSGAIIVGDQDSIHLAARNDSLGALLVLLEKGADPRAKNEFDQTPLHTAALAGLPRITGALLKTTCMDIDARDRQGQTPLSLAVKKSSAVDSIRGVVGQPSYKTVVEVLLQHGASANQSHPPP